MDRHDAANALKNTYVPIMCKIILLTCSVTPYNLVQEYRRPIRIYAMLFAKTLVDFYQNMRRHITAVPKPLLNGISNCRSVASDKFSTLQLDPHTGRFIMYSGITKIYYRKPVGHLFTKPVQTEGTTQKKFYPVSSFLS